MSDEFYALDLDTDLLWHLAIPESVGVLIAERVRDVLIEDEYVARIFNWQLAHHREHGVPATGAVLEDEFEDINLEEPEAVIEDLIVRLRERYLKNNGRVSLIKLKDDYKKAPGQLAEEMAREARHLLDLTSKRGEEYGTGDTGRAIEMYDKRKLRGRGPSFGFEEIDDHFWGQEGLSFTIGAPKTMKSWMGVQSVFRNIALGNNVWLFPLELPADQTDMRLRCMAAGIPFWKYLRGAFDPSDLKKLRQASELLDAHGSYTISKPPAGSRDFDTMFNRAADRGADLMVVDQLQYVEVDRPNRGNVALGEGDTTWYWQALNKARDLSDHMPIQIIHQFNRTVQFAEAMPDMQQAKGSAAIEETATLALGLWANKDMRQSGIVEYGTLASRNYGQPSWQVGYELSRGCNFEILGETEQE